MHWQRERLTNERGIQVGCSFSRITLLAAVWLAAHSPLLRAEGVTIITHGWNPNMAGTPAWLGATQTAIAQQRLGNDQNFGTITVTAGPTATCSPWNTSLAASPTGEIIIVLDWSAIANHLTGGPNTSAIAAAVVSKITDGQNGQRPLAELPIHLMGHSRGGGLICDLTRRLGELGIMVDHLTPLDPHPLTASDPQPPPPAPPVIDPLANVYENVLFADSYSQPTTYPAGLNITGAYNRIWTYIPGGYHNNAPPNNVYADHRNVLLAYHGTVDLNTPTNNGEATMAAAERNWFVAYETSGTARGAKAGFYYGRIVGEGNRLSADQPTGSGNRVRDGYHNGFGGAGARTAITWTGAVWPNVIILNVERGGTPLAFGTHDVGIGSTLTFRYVGRDYDSPSTVSLFADADRNPYNGNNLLAFGPQIHAASGTSTFTQTVAWNTTGRTPGSTCTIYAKITDGTRTRYLYAPPVLRFIAPPEVVYVDKDSPGPTHDGQSWATAYLTIGAAIADSDSATSPIWVANGTYMEAITLQSGRKLYGGFEGYGGAEETTVTQRNWTANEVIIDGSTADGGGPADHVVVMNGVTSTTLDGFTITGGNADGSPHPHEEGGGVLCWNANSSNLIAHCLIRNNSAQSGGGLASVDASPVIRACTLRSNTGQVWYYGGGLHCDSDGGTCAPTIINCIFTGNSGSGGAALSGYGTGVGATLTNCTISGNSSNYEGGGVYARMNAQFALINNIFEANNSVAVYEDEASEISLTNCLFHGNPDGAFRDPESGTTYSDSQVDLMNANVPNATGNVTGDPRFVNKGAGDFHLQSDSAAINKGTPDGAPSDDFDGNPRPRLAMYDIGAFEYQGSGTGPQDIYVTPASVDFGNRGTGQGASTTRTVDVFNAGGATLTITSVTLTGANSDQFLIVSDSGESSLESGEERRVSIAFDPSSLGAKAANLTIASDDPASPTANVPLTGTGVNVAPVAGRAVHGACLAFDGVNDYVNCGNSAVLMPTSAITVEAWIYANAWTVENWRGTIVGKDQMGPDSGWCLRTGDNGRATFQIANSANQWKGAMTSQLMSTGRWYHLAGTYDGNTIRTFINGEERASIDDGAAAGIAPSGCAVRIGDSGGFPGRLFNGRIDDVRVWNVARSASQIQADMNRELTGNEPGLVGYWRFNEGNGTITDDATANGNNGTLTNGPTWLTPDLGPGANANLALTVTMDSDSTVTLEGYDADGDPLTAILTQLPAAGTGLLYQYGAGGARGSLIGATPTTVLDSQMRVVYAPAYQPTSYTAVLRWKVNDGFVDSNNTATYTLTVVGNPPATPVMVAEPAWTAGTQNTVSWNAAAGATTYTAECDDAPDFATPHATASVSSPTVSHTFSGLTSGQTYWYHVRAQNGFGDSAWSAATSSTQDATLPGAPGTPTDRGAYTSSTSVRFDWTAATDTGSGVASYDLQVGTTPGGSNVFNGNVGNVLTRTVTGANGQTLYARVRARDRAGNMGAWSANSDGILIDTAAPTTPGKPTDAGAYTSSTSVRFDWTAATDTGSGIASYDLQVGTTPGGSNVFNGNVGNVLTRTVTGANGQTLYARVRARDRAGNVGAWSANSDGILIDTIAPTAPGRPTDRGAYTSSTAVRFDWTASTDTGSGVASYDLQVGTTPGGSNVFNGNVGNVLTRTVTGANGQTLYARVRARDRAGNMGAWSANSDGILIDTVAPTAPGRPTDRGAYTSSTSVRFDWTAATDTGSGIASYDLQVGTTPGGSNVFNGNVGNVLTRTVTGANGQTLYARVRARDRAGNVGAWSANSDGITIDTVRPRLTGATPLDFVAVNITFSEPAANADNASNYTFSLGLRAVGVWQMSSTQYRLYTTAQTPNTSYTVTVRSTVKDLAGNPMDSAACSRSFRGGARTDARSWELYR